MIHVPISTSETVKKKYARCMRDTYGYVTLPLSFLQSHLEWLLEQRTNIVITCPIASHEEAFLKHVGAVFVPVSYNTILKDVEIGEDSEDSFVLMYYPQEG